MKLSRSIVRTWCRMNDKQLRALHWWLGRGGLPGLTSPTPHHSTSQSLRELHLLKGTRVTARGLAVLAFDDMLMENSDV